MEETISLKEIFQVLKKRFWLIFTLTVGAVIIAAVVSYFVLTPTYQATSEFIVNSNNQQAEEVDVNDIRTNLELINTYKKVIESPRILNQVADEMGINMSAGTMQSKLNVSSEQNTQVVTVTVTDPDQAFAADLANTVFQVFKDEIPSLMNVNNVNILSEAVAVTNPSPVNPKPLLNMAIAAVLGLMIGVGIAFLLEYLDTSIKTEDDLEKQLGIPVMGIVTHIGEDEVQKTLEQRNIASITEKGGRRAYGEKAKETI
ncbi:YveK family protein [Thalassobacillus hwangdonensis]|uniref:YveK family protein n=1 Tax=Thalassobacillus hwangdonensis TaxID=546108 RepID=A0ABW3L309_9BACI